MTIKTFNIEPTVYDRFHSFCRDRGMSMSRQVQMFMQSVVEEEPEVRKDYLKKLEKLSKGRFIHIGTAKDFKKRYNIQ